MVTPPSPFELPDLDIARPDLSEEQTEAADELCKRVEEDGF